MQGPEVAGGSESRFDFETFSDESCFRTILFSDRLKARIGAGDSQLSKSTQMASQSISTEYSVMPETRGLSQTRVYGGFLK